MSRYELSPRSYTPRVIRAVVGWDRPLDTFFAQVFMKSNDPDVEEEATIWEGTAPGELKTAADALAIVEPYAVIPDDMLVRLEADQKGSQSQADGPMQIGMKEIIFRPPPE